MPPPVEEGKSVTHVSGIRCYLCLGKDIKQLTAIRILHNFADELYGSEPDGCARFSSRIHGSLRTAPNNPIAERRKTMVRLGSSRLEIRHREAFALMPALDLTPTGWSHDEP
jgi:hypothetical protein